MERIRRMIELSVINLYCTVSTGHSRFPVYLVYLEITRISDYDNKNHSNLVIKRIIMFIPFITHLIKFTSPLSF